MMFARLCCAAALYAGWTQPTALAWAELHLIAGACTAVVVFCVSTRLLGRPRVDYASARSDAGLGVFFCIVNSAGTLQTNADKIVLTRMVSPATAGAYSAAYKFVTLASMPILAIMFSVQGRIFLEAHRGGLLGALRAVRPVIALTVAYCVVAALCIYAVAPAIPWLLGASFAPSTEILQWMCLLPVLYAVQTAVSAALMGVESERSVSLLQAFSAVLALVLNLILVPSFGWHGAVIAAYASHGFLIVGLLIMCRLVLGAQRTSMPDEHGTQGRTA
jgi:O-antigen/teichoic acid export membrane protein